jgi:hypothetical protein
VVPAFLLLTVLWIGGIMRHVFTWSSVGALLVLIGLVAAGACDDRVPPTRPSPNTTTPVPPAPPGPSKVLTSLRLDGPASVPPGESAKYTATARWSDGSSRDVTSEAEWSSTDESVLLVTAPGTIAARSNGDASVQAGFEGWMGGKEVLVVPAGRYRMRVSVADGLVPVSPIFDARVEVISGPAAGLAAATKWDGAATLYGVPADVEIRVAKDGYEPVVRSVHVENNSNWVSVNLFASGGRPAITGTYRLTISSGSCSGDGRLPDAARTRTYTAAIWEPGGKVKVQLSGANFVPKECAHCMGADGNGFSGLNQALDVLFTLTEYSPPYDYGDGFHPSVAERLADGTVLVASGRAIVTPAPDGFSGTLDGSITIFRSLPLVSGEAVVLASCQSTSHGFTLVR